MKIARRFTAEGQSPYAGITFAPRRAVITGGDGTVVFEQDGVVVPAGWSDQACAVLAQKYFRKAGVPAARVPVDEPNVPDWLQRRVPAAGAALVGETDARQVFDRMAGCWTYWGWKGGYFMEDGPAFTAEEYARAFFDELRYMLAAQMAAPNSPQFFNTGIHWAYGIDGPAQGHWYYDLERREAVPSTSAYERPQPHACFIQSVADDLVNDGGIMDLWEREARLFKYGSGTGSNFSSLRGGDEPLSGGGKSSGLMSWLKIGDAAAGAIKSGGTTRRAAKMVVVDVDHPDIEKVIDWKQREEMKVAALVAGSVMIRHNLEEIAEAHGTAELARQVGLARVCGVPDGLINRALQALAANQPLPDMPEMDVGWEGEAYQTVSGQNANITVRVTDEFMRRVQDGGDWQLTRRVDGRPAKTLPARALMDRIAAAAWASADPGLHFDTTFNDWHTCPNSGRLNATNPCSEYAFLDDTACNLASLNLLAFLPEDGPFDLASYVHATRLWTLVLEISVHMAQFPSKRIAELSHRYRTLGLGYANLGGLLMALGLPYDSPQGRAWCAGLTAVMTGEAYAMSAEIAGALGPFEGYAENASQMLRVIGNHRRAAHAGIGDFVGLSTNPVSLDRAHCPTWLAAAAMAAWNRAALLGEQHGFRNAQATCIAPTGTIALVMDCATTGIEPDFGLVKSKSLAGGGDMRFSNPLVVRALRELGYAPQQIEAIAGHIDQTGTVAGAPGIEPRHAAVFQCASGPDALSPEAHLLMMAAAQPFVSGAISKTINLPATATVDDVRQAYIDSWKLGIKAIALYRDGSKLSQPLTAIAEAAPAAAPPAAAPTVAHAPVAGGRRKLPARRSGYTQKARVNGNTIYHRTGVYPDGMLGEIFVDMFAEGTGFRAILNAFAKAVSIGLQYGVPLEEFVDAFINLRFEPAGPVQHHERIRMAASPLDYIFRDLAIEYLGRDDLAHVGVEAAPVEAAAAPAPLDSKRALAQRLGYDGDPCGACGNFTLVRSGTCLKCNTCGGTTGCS